MLKRSTVLKRIFSLWIFVWPIAAFGQQVVTYPRAESSGDARTSYPVALLNLCAEKSNHQFVFRPSEFHAQQDRAIRQLSLGKGLDILWAVTNQERENLLRPIRIPIDRGLIGWRLLLIRNSDAELFDAITTADQIAALRAGQGHDWPDVEVLRTNGFNVSTGTTYEGLFNMLALGHIQYFPRSIAEIWPELKAHDQLDIGVQKTLVIHYPEALYFFVNQKNTVLADAISTCLNTATADGTLRTLFYQYYRESIARANLPQRRIIRLENTLLPQSAPSQSEIYWFSPLEMP